MITATHWCVTCDEVPVPRWGYQCPSCALLSDEEQERDPSGDRYDAARDEYERSIGG